MRVLKLKEEEEEGEEEESAGGETDPLKVRRRRIREMRLEKIELEVQKEKLKTQKEIDELKSALVKEGPKPLSEEEKEKAEEEREEADERRELRRETRLTKLEAKRIKAERELAQLTGAESASTAAKPGLGSKLLATFVQGGMAPDKAAETIKSLDDEAIGRLVALETAPSNPLLPLILMGRQQGTSIKDLKEFAEIIALKTTGQESFTDYYEKIVKPVIDQNKELLTSLRDIKYDMLSKEIGEIKNRPGALQELHDKEEEYKAMQKIFSGGALGAGQYPPDIMLASKKIDLEIEQERTRREEMAIDRKRHWDLEEKKLGEEQRRTDAFMGFGETIVKGVVKEFTVEGGEEAQPKAGGTVQPTVEGFEVKTCPGCGAPIPVNMKERPSQIKCSACDATIKVKW